MFNQIEDGLGSAIVKNGSAYQEVRKRLTIEQRIEFAFTLESEAIFMIASKLLSEPVEITAFQTIIVAVESPGDTIDNDLFKAKFDESYMRFLSQSYLLPDEQLAKLKYIFKPQKLFNQPYYLPQ